MFSMSIGDAKRRQLVATAALPAVYLLVTASCHFFLGEQAAATIPRGRPPTNQAPAPTVSGGDRGLCGRTLASSYSSDPDKYRRTISAKSSDTSDTSSGTWR